MPVLTFCFHRRLFQLFSDQTLLPRIYALLIGVGLGLQGLLALGQVQTALKLNALMVVAMAFNIYGNTGTTLVGGVAASSVAEGTYYDVLQGFTSLNHLTGTSGSYGGLNYRLVADTANAGFWNLVFSLPASNINAGNTYQSSDLLSSVNPVFDGGTLQVSGATTIPTAFTVSSQNGAIDQNGHAANFSGAIVGTGKLTIVNTGAPLQGSVTLSGNNTYSGGTEVDAGANLVINDPANLGAASGTLSLVGSATVPAVLTTTRTMAGVSARSDEGADVFAGQGAGQVARHQSIDDLDLAHVAGGLEQVQHGEFQDGVVEPLGLHFIHGNFRDKGGVLVGLGIARVKAVFVLHINHGLAAELFRHQEAARVGAVGGNDAFPGRANPHFVGGHAAENHPIDLGQVQGHGGEPGPIHGGNAVFGQELAEHVQFRQGPGQALQFGHRFQQLVQDALVEPFFPGQGPFLGRKGLVFKGLQFRGDIALGIFQGLPTPVILRHLVPVGVGDFDVKTMLRKPTSKGALWMTSSASRMYSRKSSAMA